MNDGIEGFQFDQEFRHTGKTRLMNKLIPVEIKSCLNQLSAIRSIAGSIVTNSRNSHQKSEKQTRPKTQKLTEPGNPAYPAARLIPGRDYNITAFPNHSNHSQ